MLRTWVSGSEGSRERVIVKMSVLSEFTENVMSRIDQFRVLKLPCPESDMCRIDFCVTCPEVVVCRSHLNPLTLAQLFHNRLTSPSSSAPPLHLSPGILRYLEVSISSSSLMQTSLFLMLSSTQSKLSPTRL